MFKPGKNIPDIEYGRSFVLLLATLVGGVSKHGTKEHKANTRKPTSTLPRKLGAINIPCEQSLLKKNLRTNPHSIPPERRAQNINRNTVSVIYQKAGKMKSPGSNSVGVVM
ncbi:hypothetical protein BKA65DRAFT_483937 [Rhexocercosporidium sp. MPI-PUGE-AT-0058]|nr:hypothetical protein BKA65DRAFT_483937 [Rhexocercosporidium sp. MPI-PUGE-AT-0058]